MRTFYYLFGFVFAVGLIFLYPLQAEAGGDKAMEMVNNIHWLGQAAVKVNAGDKVVYFDPYQIKEQDKADIILITHGHGDHLSTGDISKVTTENTVIIAPKSCESDLSSVIKAKLLLSEPGFKENVEGITIEAVPAYNAVKTNFHPKENNWVGYIITVDGVRIYHAGDTERIPEMKTFSCDIAMLPLGQTYTMNSVEDAAKAAMDVKSKIAIPIHYDMYEGTKADAERFKTLLEGKVTVVIK
jgi:L-ascorbate metabolism protein UlaG (beta-lactamase superfamily)